MSWEHGLKAEYGLKDVNKELSEVKGYLTEKEAQIWLAKFFRENMSIFSKYLTGVELLNFQSLMIKTMFKIDYFLAICSRGSGKCEKWDNLIWTDKGLKRMIDVEVGDYVQSIKDRNLVLAKTVNPSQTTYKLTTSHGFTSEGLDYHRVLKLNLDTLKREWTFSKDVKVGDYLVCRKGDNFWISEEAREESILFLKNIPRKNFSLDDVKEIRNILLNLNIVTCSVCDGGNYSLAVSPASQKEFYKIFGPKTPSWVAQKSFSGESFLETTRDPVFISKVIETSTSENVTVDLQVENEKCYVSDGIVSHNTFLSAVFLILYATLNHGVKIRVIANSFRQSRLLMQKILDIRLGKNAGMLRQIIKEKDISQRNDELIIKIGASQIIALPLGDGSRLRGYRFKVMVIDELLLLPSKIINEVIKPFLSTNTDVIERKKVTEAEDALIAQGKLKPEDRTKWGHNKFIGLSSASFTFEYLYEIYKRYEDIILEGKGKEDDDLSARHGIFHVSYDCLPPELYDQGAINDAKKTFSEAQFAREYLSRFTDDSSGYFKMSKMAACTHQDGEGQCVEAIGDKDGIYILSGDISWSESEASDDFVLHVLKYVPETGAATVVHSYALSGTAMKEHIKYFHFLYTNFRPQLIILDFMGGVQFLSAVNESELFKKDNIEIKTIDVDIEDPTKYNEDIRAVRNLHNVSDHRVCIQRKPSGNYIRRANELLQAAFDHKKMWFASRAIDDDFYYQINLPIPVDDLKFLRDNSNLAPSTVDFIETLKTNVDMIKVQCSLIEVTSTPQGNQTFDLPPNLKKQRNASKARRDSYTALVLGNWGVSVYRDMLSAPKEEEYEGYIPCVIS